MRVKILYFFAIMVVVSCMEPVAREPIVVKSSSFMNESITFNRVLIEKEELLFKNMIANDSLTNYKTSPNGFWYTYNVESTKSYLASKGDELNYTFDVYNINGQLIYNSDEIGTQTYFVDQQDLIEGLRNGLKLMHEGDVVTFLFPSHKVFGYLGDEKKIEINQPLIYKVQLNKIKKKNESN